jgi:hypothetical protein
MAGDCTRRDFLVRLSAAHAAFFLGCQRSGGEDWLARERVCIHVFDPRGLIAKPLLADLGSPPERGNQAYFNFGLPELAVCSTQEKFLQMFQYFWPVTQDEIAHLRRTVEVKFQRAAINGADDVQQLGSFLRDHQAGQARGTTSAVLLTYNDYTRFWARAVIRAAQETKVDEFVLFKNPALPPYLCDYPAAQKGFKKPPR